jgi:hypothetical protein
MARKKFAIARGIDAKKEVSLYRNFCPFVRRRNSRSLYLFITLPLLSVNKERLEPKA